MARATVEKKHLLPVALTAVLCFVAMGFLVQAGRSAIYVGGAIVAVAFAVTLVLILVRRRRNARLMRDVLEDR